MSIKIIVSCLFLFTSLTCVQLQSISINSQPDLKERDLRIEATSSKFVFLAFNFNNDFLEETPKKLIEQCQGGKIKGIVTKFETVSYVFFTDFIVKANGYCVQ
jgi:hypothetical protein